MRHEIVGPVVQIVRLERAPIRETDDMYAVVRDNTFDLEKLAAGEAQMREFQDAHAARTGYVGSVVVDAGAGRQLSFTLWRSEAEAEAARRALGPTIGSVLQPLMAKPSTLVAAGEVAFQDLLVREGAE